MTATAAALIRLNLRDPAAGPVWLRAAKAQLISYPTRHLAAELRRDLAIGQHGAAKPDRDLTSAAWAAPLRASQAGLELLIAFIYRLRLGAADPYQIPADIRTRYHLSVAAADRLLRATLWRLRELRPDFFHANVGNPLALAAQLSLDAVSVNTVPTDLDSGPEHQALAREQACRARTLLHRLVSPQAGDGPVRLGRRRAYRKIVLAVATAIDTDRRDLLAVCARQLGLSEMAATRLLRRLARLVADADPGWTEQLLRTQPA